MCFERFDAPPDCGLANLKLRASSGKAARLSNSEENWVV